MSCLSWNCRGLGNSQAIQYLRCIVEEKRPTFLFLIETLCDLNKINQIKVLLGYDDCLVVDCIGHSGGLALMWKSTATVNHIYSSNHCIDVAVTISDISAWRLTGFYGQPDRSRPSESQNLLLHLVGRSSLPWVLMDEFNDILAQHEKRGVSHNLCI